MSGRDGSLNAAMFRTPVDRSRANARVSQAMNMRTRRDNCRLRGQSNDTGVGEGGWSGSTPEDIASAVSFLAGPEGGWINGQVLRANGGLV